MGKHETIDGDGRFKKKNWFEDCKGEIGVSYIWDTLNLYF